MLELLLHHVPALIFFKDASSVYIDCNRSSLRDPGLNSVKELGGNTNFDFFPGNIPENIMSRTGR
jgi:hypothetical protein